MHGLWQDLRSGLHMQVSTRASRRSRFSRWRLGSARLSPKGLHVIFQQPSNACSEIPEVSAAEEKRWTHYCTTCGTAREH
jgi:hypothetical protein